MLWEYLKEEEFKKAREASKGVCIVPVGCVEKHGQHMPLGTDVLFAKEAAKAACEIEEAVVFPGMYFGEKTGAGEFDGTIIFSAPLRYEILKETCSEIGRNGFNKIILLNGHGGNSAMLNNFARSVLYEKKDYMVFIWGGGVAASHPSKVLEKNYDYLTDEDKKFLQHFCDTSKEGGHGCFVEAGRFKHIYPDLVDMEKMLENNGLSTHRFDEFSKLGIYSPFGWMANYPDSFVGEYYDGLNERIAKAMFDCYVEKLAEVIKFMKEDTVAEEYHKEWLAKQK